jgi:hypothetical protein
MKSLLLSMKKSEGCTQVQLKEMKFEFIKAAITGFPPAAVPLEFALMRSFLHSSSMMSAIVEAGSNPIMASPAGD